MRDFVYRLMLWRQKLRDYRHRARGESGRSYCQACFNAEWNMEHHGCNFPHGGASFLAETLDRAIVSGCIFGTFCSKHGYRGILKPRLLVGVGGYCPRCRDIVAASSEGKFCPAHGGRLEDTYLTVEELESLLAKREV